MASDIASYGNNYTICLFAVAECGAVVHSTKNYPHFLFHAFQSDSLMFFFVCKAMDCSNLIRRFTIGSRKPNSIHGKRWKREFSRRKLIQLATIILSWEFAYVRMRVLRYDKPNRTTSLIVRQTIQFHINLARESLANRFIWNLLTEKKHTETRMQYVLDGHITRPQTKWRPILVRTLSSSHAPMRDAFNKISEFSDLLLSMCPVSCCVAFSGGFLCKNIETQTQKVPLPAQLKTRMKIY